MTGALLLVRNSLGMNGERERENELVVVELNAESRHWKWCMCKRERVSCAMPFHALRVCMCVCVCRGVVNRLKMVCIQPPFVIALLGKLGKNSFRLFQATACVGRESKRKNEQ